jgi:mannose-1-phosphate guanylyltransferase
LEFHKIVRVGLREAKNGKIVVFGIPPSRPETGYGYLELKNKSFDTVVELINFVEKPD